VTVTNVADSATSKAVKLTVNVPPTILSQPQNVIVTNGDWASFSVSASGTAPLSYQWLQNGTALTGATNPVLAITNAQPANAGYYMVVVTNMAGSVPSQPATLTSKCRRRSRANPRA